MAGILEQSKEIRKIWGGFQSARVLITANNYRVFDCLGRQKTAKGLARELRTDKRATEILLDALAGQGLLIKQKSKYRNARLASRFLVSKSPYYQGEIIKHADSLWDRWSDLDRIVRTGKHSESSRDHKSFILGMHNLSVMKVKDVIRETGLSGVKKSLDLGGGPGTYSIEMAKKGVHVALFDTPETIRIARTVVKDSGVDHKNIYFIGGDFLTDDFGSGYDLILISQIVHMFSEKINLKLLRKCRKALNKNGRVVIHDFLINENRTRPPWGSLFAVNMLVNTESGRSYAPEEMKLWLSHAGLKNIRKKILADGVLVSARKE
jgi:2-polyprenyl-3-methyl-5-hydroxy-6-metoxy-1,4-benzoquinol methylase